MRVFATKEFARYARKERIRADQICKAIARAEQGLIDANLGGGVIKQRIARAGKGRSGGYRSVIAFRTEVRSVFMYGFAKSRKASLTPDELAVYRQLAHVYLSATVETIEALLDDDELSEINCDDEAFYEAPLQE